MNQLRAHQSWILAFERIVYAGEFSPELCSISSEFVPGEDRPSIQSLCKIAAQMGTWTALINADLVVSPKLRDVESMMDQAGIKCAVTRRYDLESGFIIDWGLDMFLATSEVWSRIYKIIPPDFTISRGGWDSWMVSAFVSEFGRKCADVTRERLCLHPRHGDRLDPNWTGSGQSHKYATTHHWPTTILR